MGLAMGLCGWSAGIMGDRGKTAEGKKLQSPNDKHREELWVDGWLKLARAGTSWGKCSVFSIQFSVFRNGWCARRRVPLVRQGGTRPYRKRGECVAADCQERLVAMVGELREGRGTGALGMGGVSRPEGIRGTWLTTSRQACRWSGVMSFQRSAFFKN